MTEEKIRKNVREGYAKVGRQQGSCCGPASSCCGSGDTTDTIAQKVGYSKEDLAAVPEGSNLGLGCGNPVAMASLKPGETVLDLGSGPGFDCFLAARRVGETGRVIGVDMTPEMLARGRDKARKGDTTTSNSDWARSNICQSKTTRWMSSSSNCVINLSTDKAQVFHEAFRVLKPGGRLMISDTVIIKPLPEFLQRSMAAYVGCVSGAMRRQDYVETVKAAGFKDVLIVKETPFSLDCIMNDPMAQAIAADANAKEVTLKEIEGSLASIQITGIKR